MSTQWTQLTLDDLGIPRERITPEIARTVAESLRSLADGNWYGQTARWSAESLRGLADEIEQIASRD